MIYRHLQAIKREKFYLGELYFGAFPDVPLPVKIFHALRKHFQAGYRKEIATRILAGDTFLGYLE
jgi:hypothetical protein